MAIVDSRYARAFASVVESQHVDSTAAQAQLKDFANTMTGSRELRELLENPSLPEDQKLRVIDAIAGKLGMAPAVRNFIAVIPHHGRLQDLATILSAYAELADEATGVAEVEITTARPLDPASHSLLEQQVAKLAGGQKVRATYTEDASLLGGAVVRLGSTVYDGSVRGQLQQMKQKLMTAAL